MFINRFRHTMASEGRTIRVGDVTIFLRREAGPTSALVIGIDAPADVPITVEKGIAAEKPQKRLPIPPSA